MHASEEIMLAEIARHDRRYRDAARHYVNAADRCSDDPPYQFALVLEASTMLAIAHETAHHEFKQGA